MVLVCFVQSALHPPIHSYVSIDCQCASESVLLITRFARSFVRSFARVWLAAELRSLLCQKGRKKKTCLVVKVTNLQADVLSEVAQVLHVPHSYLNCEQLFFKDFQSFSFLFVTVAYFLLLFFFPLLSSVSLSYP